MFNNWPEVAKQLPNNSTRAGPSAVSDDMSVYLAVLTLYGAGRTSACGSEQDSAVTLLMTSGTHVLVSSSEK